MSSRGCFSAQLSFWILNKIPRWRFFFQNYVRSLPFGQFAQAGPLRAWLVLVLYFAFCPLGLSRVELSSCIVVLQLRARSSETFCHFFVTVNNFYLLDLRAEAIERRLVIRLAVDSDWLQKGQDGRRTRKKKTTAQGWKIEVFW